MSRLSLFSIKNWYFPNINLILYINKLNFSIFLWFLLNDFINIVQHQKFYQTYYLKQIILSIWIIAGWGHLSFVLVQNSVSTKLIKLLKPHYLCSDTFILQTFLFETLLEIFVLTEPVHHLWHSDASKLSLISVLVNSWQCQKYSMLSTVQVFLILTKLLVSATTSWKGWWR